jgi:hypothetical protein
LSSGALAAACPLGQFSLARDDRLGCAYRSGLRCATVVKRGFLGTVVVSACLTLIVLAPAPAGAAPEWQEPVDISLAGHSADVPQIAFDSQGNAIAVWRRALRNNSEPS